VQLGILFVLQGKSDEARPVLAEALNLSLAARSTPWTALSLAGRARLALATGAPRSPSDPVDGRVERPDLSGRG
jgi:hypothetical protein